LKRSEEPSFIDEIEVLESMVLVEVPLVVCRDMLATHDLHE